MWDLNARLWFIELNKYMDFYHTHHQGFKFNVKPWWGGFDLLALIMIWLMTTPTPKSIGLRHDLGANAFFYWIKLQCGFSLYPLLRWRFNVKPWWQGFNLLNLTWICFIAKHTPKVGCPKGDFGAHLLIYWIYVGCVFQPCPHFRLEVQCMT